MAFSISVIVSACLHNKGYEGEGYTLTLCDTSNFSYRIDIQPILDANCASCHNVNYAESGVVLDNYTDVKQQADNTNFNG